MTDFIPPSRPVTGVHHVAYRCRDAGQTRWFYEDILGLPAIAGLVSDIVPGTNAETPFMHLFFAMGDGGYLAFFDSPADADPAWFDDKSSFDMHIAMEVSSEDDLLAMQQRLESKGINTFGPLDHDFVKSIYMRDPNGIQVELTVRTPEHDVFMAHERAALPDVLRAWSVRTRALKTAKFGEESLELRLAHAE